MERHLEDQKGRREQPHRHPREVERRCEAPVAVVDALRVEAVVGVPEEQPHRDQVVREEVVHHAARAQVVLAQPLPLRLQLDELRVDVVALDRLDRAREHLARRLLLGRPVARAQVAEAERVGELVARELPVAVGVELLPEAVERVRVRREELLVLGLELVAVDDARVVLVHPLEDLLELLERSGVVRRRDVLQQHQPDAGQQARQAEQRRAADEGEALRAALCAALRLLVVDCADPRPPRRPARVERPPKVGEQRRGERRRARRGPRVGLALAQQASHREQCPQEQRERRQAAVGERREGVGGADGRRGGGGVAGGALLEAAAAAANVQPAAHQREGVVERGELRGEQGEEATTRAAIGRLQPRRPEPDEAGEADQLQRDAERRRRQAAPRGGGVGGEPRLVRVAPALARAALLDIEEHVECDPDQDRPDLEAPELPLVGGGDAGRLVLARLGALGVGDDRARVQLDEAEHAGDAAGRDEGEPLGLDDERRQLVLVVLVRGEPERDDRDRVDAVEREEEDHVDREEQRLPHHPEEGEVVRQHRVKQGRLAPVEPAVGRLGLVLEDALAVLVELEAQVEHEPVEDALLHLGPHRQEDAVDRAVQGGRHRRVMQPRQHGGADLLEDEAQADDEATVRLAPDVAVDLVEGRLGALDHLADRPAHLLGRLGVVVEARLQRPALREHELVLPRRVRAATELAHISLCGPRQRLHERAGRLSLGTEALRTLHLAGNRSAPPPS